MSRIAITDEQRTLSFIETATKEQLNRLIDRAQLVKRVVYPEAAPKPAARRTRGPGRPKSTTGSMKDTEPGYGANAGTGAGAPA